MSTLTIGRCGPLHGCISVPGDKSISHRALLLAAIARGRSRIGRFLDSGDCQATMAVTSALGAGHRWDGADLIVEGVGMKGLREPSRVLDCAGSGTTMRLSAGLLAGQGFLSILAGNSALSRRPMGRVAEPLRLMGATVLGRQGGHLPPLVLLGGKLHAIDYQMPVASAQVKSAIHLAGLYADGVTTVHEREASRDHTERMLTSLGVAVHCHGKTIAVEPPAQDLTPVDMAVPGDISSAAFPLIAACLVPGSDVVVQGVGVNPTRTGILDVLGRMGARLEHEMQPPAGSEPVAHLRATAGHLRATAIGGAEIPRLIDELPILAVAATQAEGVTEVHDAAELRVKESDRISALAEELRKMGARIEEFPDGFAIEGPTRLVGTMVHGHGDHRLAMSLAVAGLIADGQTAITDAECIADSYPGFAAMLAELGAMA